MSRSTTSASRNHQVLLRYMEILNSGDPEHLAEVLDPDYVQVIPQSGEILRGIEPFAQIMRNWPSGEAHPDLVGAQVVPTGTHDILSGGIGPFPTYNLIKVEGDGDTLTSYSLVRYPDGADWFAVSIATLRDGKILKELFFFGPMFEAPGWRSAWMRPMTPEEHLDLVGFKKD